MITNRDREIIRTLLEKVRVLSLEQVAATWWQGDPGPAARRLRKLSAAGWLAGERLLARPMLPLDAPLLSWEPTGPKPDFGPVSWRARARWKLPARPTPVWHVTPLAASRLGGSGRTRVKNLCQVTHDLHVSEVYVRLLRADDRRARWWVGEDVLPEGLIAPLVPDAVLLRGGEIALVIEFGGAYPKRRFESFHEHCCHLRLPYLIY